MTAPSVADLPLVSGHVALDLVNTVEPRLPVAGRHEHLAVPGDVLAWARLVHLVDAAEAEAVAAAWATSPASAERALIAVRQVREALAAVLSAVLAERESGTGGPAGTGRAGPAGDVAGELAGGVSGELEYLSAAWAAAAARSRLDLAAAGGPVARRDPGARGEIVAGRDLGSADGAVAWLNVGSAPALLVPDRVAHAAVDLLCGTDLAHLAMCPVEEGGCGWLFLDGSRNRSRRWCTMAACGSFAKARRLTERRRVARSATGETENTSS